MTTEIRECMPLRIAFIENSLIGNGAERVVVTLANAMRRAGHSVDIILARKIGPFLRDVDKDVNIRTLWGGRMLFAIVSLLNVLRTSQYEVVIGSQDQPNMCLLLLQPFLPKTTLCFVIEHLHPLLSDEAARGKVIWQAVRRLRPFLYPRANRIIAVSEEVRKVLISDLNCPSDRTVTIYNPIDLERIQRDAQVPCQHQWLSPKTRPTLLAVGKLVSQKNFALLLHAVALLRERMDVQLIVLGEGELRPNLEALRRRLGLDDCVDLAGYSSNPFSFMARADVFVLSSQWESFGNVVVEALACGTPIVSTDCPAGPSEILQGGRFGRLVPVDNANALADAIEQTLASSTDSEPLRLRAERFEPARVAAEYLELVRQAAGDCHAK